MLDPIEQEHATAARFRSLAGGPCNKCFAVRTEGEQSSELTDVVILADAATAAAPDYDTGHSR